MKKAVFSLEPLSCPGCAKNIETSLQKIDGIEEVKVLFYSNRVRTAFNTNLIKAEEIQKALISLGYPVTSQKVSSV